MRIYWIGELEQGDLGMMARPRGNDWLEDEIKKLSFQNVHSVVSLVESHEMQELGIEREGAYCNQYGIEFIHFPIPDLGIPDATRYIQLVSGIDAQLKKGHKVVIHCRMGIGRTSTVAAGVLIKQGYKPQTVFNVLSEKRTLKVPDTKEQSEWVLEMSEKLLPGNGKR